MNFDVKFEQNAMSFNPTFGAVIRLAGGGSSAAIVYVPSVSEDGVLSWTNNGNLPNPTPVKIVGGGGITEEELADKMNEVVTQQYDDFIEETGKSVPIVEVMWDLASMGSFDTAYVVAYDVLEELGFIIYDEETGEYRRNAVTHDELDEAVGDIETALDAILAIQNKLIGGDGV